MRKSGRLRPDPASTASSVRFADRPVLRSRKSGGASLPRRVPSSRSGCVNEHWRFVPRSGCRDESATTRRASVRVARRKPISGAQRPQLPLGISFASDYSADYIQEKTALASRDARQRPVSHAPKQSRSPSVEFNLGRDDRSIGLTRTFDLDTAAICNLLAWVVELRGAVRHHPGARHGEGQRRAGPGQI